MKSFIKHIFTLALIAIMAGASANAQTAISSTQSLRYTSSTSTTGNDYFVLGSKASFSTSMTIDGGSYYFANFKDNTVSFTVAANTAATVKIYIAAKSGVSFSLRPYTVYNDAITPTSGSTAGTGNENAQVATYSLASSGGPVTYYLTNNATSGSDARFGGIVVTVGGSSEPDPTPDPATGEEYSYSALSVTDLTEWPFSDNRMAWRPTAALDANSYLRFSEDVATHYFAGSEASGYSTGITVSTPPVDTDGFTILSGDNVSSNTVTMNASQAIGFKLKANTNYRIKIYYKGNVGRHIHLVKSNDLYTGADAAAGSSKLIATGESPNGWSTNTLVAEFSTGSSDEVFWISGDETGITDGDPANPEIYFGGYDVEVVTSVTPPPSTGDDPDAAEVAVSGITLNPITQHYLWKAPNGTNMTSGYTDSSESTLNTADTKPNMVYVGNGASFLSETTVSIEDYNGSSQGASTGTYRADAHDYWAVLVAGNGKQGTVKTYFKADTEAVTGAATTITFNEAYLWQTQTIYGGDAGKDCSNYQFVRVKFGAPLPIPLILRAQNVDTDNCWVEIPEGATEGYLYLDPDVIGADKKIRQIALQSTATGFPEGESHSYSVSLTNIDYLETPLIGKGTNPNDHTAGYELLKDATVETLADGTEVLIYPFNHETGSSDQLYWVSGVQSRVRIGAIEVVFDEARTPDKYNAANITTTYVDQIPTSEMVDGHPTLKWRVDSYDDNGTLYGHSYYEPAGGGKYYQYIYNKTQSKVDGKYQAENLTLKDVVKSTGVSSVNGSTALNGKYVDISGRNFGQVIKLEPNTHYRITIYTDGNDNSIQNRFVNAKGTVDSDGKLSVLSTDGLPNLQIRADGKAVIEFVTSSSSDDCYYWILGRNNDSKTYAGNMYDSYIGFDLSLIQHVTDRSSTNASNLEKSSLDGSAGEYYRSKADNNGAAFPYKPRQFKTVDGDNTYYCQDTDETILKLKDGNTKTMNVMFGSDGTYIWRSENSAYHFHEGGLIWKAMASNSNNGGFLDGRFTYSAGDNNSVKSSYNSTGEYSKNANPQTEINGGIGGQTTEYGGRFLQPVSGDFFRLEPEYDGVVTLWFLQNGNTDAKTPKVWKEDSNGNVKIENGSPVIEPDRGNLTRRPVYVVDEDGVIMQRSTVKPDNDYSKASHYAINGTWAHINDFAWVRDDYELGWLRALERWLKKSHTYNGYTVNDTEGLSDRYKETMKMYAYWYDGGSYDYNKPGELMTINSIDVHNHLNNGSDDRTTYVNRTQLIGHILYGSDVFRAREETNSLNTRDKFAKYGYEVPVHVNVRYVFPVRAGKTYYIGGRGTKNGFSSVKFEPMEPNYNSADYISKDNNTDVSYPEALNGKYKLTAIASDGGKTFSHVTLSTAYSNSTVKTITLDNDGITWTLNGSSTTEPDVNTTVHGVVNRRFTAGNWHPIVLPFSVSESKLREVFGSDVKVLYLDPLMQASTGTGKFKGTHTDGTQTVTNEWTSVYAPAIENSRLTFTRHYYQMIYANMPAFICPSNTVNSADFGYVNYRGTTIDKYNIGSGYRMAGSYTPTTKGSGDNKKMYYLTNIDGNAVIYHAAAGRDMDAMRVWIVPVDPDAAPLRTVNFASYDGCDLEGEGVTSGIEDLIMDDTVIDMYNDDNVYDMIGRVVGHGSLNGLPNGMYIFRGQKHYVR